MNLDEFTTEVRERLRADMQAIRHPEGDIHPALFYVFETAINRFKIPKTWFSSRSSKDAMARAIGQATKIARPRMIGWTTTSYVLEVPKENIDEYREERKTTQIKDMPGNREVVVLVTLDREGYRYLECEITRDGINPPSYGGWTVYEDIDELQGYVLEPIVEAQGALR